MSWVHPENWLILSTPWTWDILGTPWTLRNLGYNLNTETSWVHPGTLSCIEYTTNTETSWVYSNHWETLGTPWTLRHLEYTLNTDYKNVYTILLKYLYLHESMLNPCKRVYWNWAQVLTAAFRGPEDDAVNLCNCGYRQLWTIMCVWRTELSPLEKKKFSKIWPVSLALESLFTIHFRANLRK